MEVAKVRAFTTDKRQRKTLRGDIKDKIMQTIWRKIIVYTG